MRQALEHAPVSQTNSDALIDSLMSLSLDLPPQVRQTFRADPDVQACVATCSAWYRQQILTGGTAAVSEHHRCQMT